jgi:cell division protein ZapA
MKRSVTVEIAGQRFTLKTDADDDYVHRLASFVSAKLKDAKAGSRAFSTHALAILAALQIADELMQAREDLKSLKDGVRRRAHRIQALLDSAGREPTPR